MKKTRLVGLLLVFVLVTSCFAGGTFAKYASSATGTDDAVVAKWSITGNDQDIAQSNTFTFDLFNKSAIADTKDGENNDENVDDGSTFAIIAPGTKGSFSFTVTNNSEVTAKYSYTLKAEQSNTDSKTIPIEYSLTGTSGWTDDITTLTATGNLKTATAANGDNSDKATIEVYWRWAIGNTSADDTNDTELGVLAQNAANIDARPTVTVTITLNAEQVD